MPEAQLMASQTALIDSGIALATACSDYKRRRWTDADRDAARECIETRNRKNKVQR